jgi:hypothetical protein
VRHTSISFCSDPADLAAENRELHRLRAQVEAVRALAKDAMKLPTLDDPRPADDRVSPRAILAALGEWPCRTTLGGAA